MAEPTKKSGAIEVAIGEITGINRRAHILKEICPFCNKPAQEFRNEISRREHTISGLCQACQDKMFGKD